MQTILYAALVVLFMLSLYYYWFALANRHTIFLYDHLGATPFDSRTVGRYSMTGTVAAGAVMVMYLFVNWLAGRISGLKYRIYRPPACCRSCKIAVNFFEF